MDINEAKASVEIYAEKLKDLEKNLDILEKFIKSIVSVEFGEFKGSIRKTLYRNKKLDDMLIEHVNNVDNILDFYIKESCNIQDTLQKLTLEHETETYCELKIIINKIIIICNEILINKNETFCLILQSKAKKTLKCIEHLKESKQQQENKSKSNFIEQLKNILEERQAKYGEPKQNFEDIGKRWSKILGIEVTPKQVAIMMIEFKLVRLNKTVDCYDTLLDICGYCECMSRL